MNICMYVRMYACTCKSGYKYYDKCDYDKISNQLYDFLLSGPSCACNASNDYILCIHTCTCIFVIKIFIFSVKYFFLNSTTTIFWFTEYQTFNVRTPCTYMYNVIRFVCNTEYKVT